MLTLLLAFAVAPPPAPRLNFDGDPLPDGALARLGSPRWRGPASGVLAYSTDGKWIAVGSPSDHSAALYDARTGKRLWVARAPAGRGRAGGVINGTVNRQRLLFSADGDRLYWVDGGLAVRALAVPGGTLSATFDVPPSPDLHIGLSADGTELTALAYGIDRPGTYADAALVRWDVASGRRLGSLELKAIARPVLAPRGDLLAYQTKDRADLVVSVVETRAGKPLWKEQHSKVPLNPVRFSPDSAALVGMLRPLRGVGATWPFAVYDARTGKERFRFRYDGWDVSFLPDGKAFIAWGQGVAPRLLDAVTGDRLPVLDGMPTTKGVGVGSAALGDGGRTLLLNSLGALRLIDVKTGRPRLSEEADWIAGPFAFAPDGKSLLIDGITAVREAEVPGGRLRSAALAKPTSAGTLLAVSADGTRVTASTGRGVMSLYDRGTGKALHELRFPPADHIHCVRFAPDGRTVYATNIRGTVHRWDSASGKALEPISWEGATGRATPSGDSKRLLGLDRRGRFTWLDLQTGAVREGWTPERTNVTAFVPMPGGKEVAASYPATGKAAEGVVFHDAATGKALRSWERTGAVTHPVVSTDGKLFASPSVEMIRLWDVATAREHRPLVVGRRGTTQVAFSPDGRYLATRGEHQIVLWDVAALTRAGGTSFALGPAGWRRAWDELGGPRSEAFAPYLHAALEQTLEEMPRAVSHDATPENARRAKAGRELLRRIGTPAALALLRRLDDAPAGSSWRSP